MPAEWHVFLLSASGITICLYYRPVKQWRRKREGGRGGHGRSNQKIGGSEYVLAPNFELLDLGRHFHTFRSFPKHNKVV